MLLESNKDFRPTIGSLIKFCTENPGKTIPFTVVGCGSWRGVYSLPCLYYNVANESTAADMLPFLKELLENKFDGPSLTLGIIIILVAFGMIVAAFLQ